MRISADWQDHALNAAPEEAATVADVKLFVADRNVTQHLLARRVSDEITIPLYTIAEVLAYTWWSIFGARDREVSIADHCSGLQIPDIRLSFDGVSARCLVSTARQAADERRSIRYIVSAEELLDRADAERRLIHLIDTVLRRLNDRDLPETSAAVRWKRVLESRADPDEAAFCEAAGALGRDPYQIDDADALLIEQSAALFSGEALLEFLAGIGANGRERRRPDQLTWMEAAEARSSDLARVPRLSAVARSLDVDRALPRRAWAHGYRRARDFRREIDLGGSGRVWTVAELAQRLDASRAFAPAPTVNGLRALRSDHGGDVHIHLRETGREEANLFGFARACGDVVCFPAPGRSVINDLQSAYRQAAGRAFAAEFLAPIDEIRSMQADGYDRLAMAGERGVSTGVIDRQIENAGRIDEACAA